MSYCKSICQTPKIRGVGFSALISFFIQSVAERHIISLLLIEMTALSHFIVILDPRVSCNADSNLILTRRLGIDALTRVQVSCFSEVLLHSNLLSQQMNASIHVREVSDSTMSNVTGCIIIPDRIETLPFTHLSKENEPT